MRPPQRTALLSLLGCALVSSVPPGAANAQPCALTELQKFTGLDTDDDDHFGASVAASKDLAIVGAWGADMNGASPGAAYIFRRDDKGTPTLPADDVWIQQAKLTPEDAVSGSLFGWTVAISGKRAVVGARFQPPSQSGAAYVFRLDDNGTPIDPNDDFWVQEAKLTASDAAGGDQLGYAVAISGRRAIVGAFLTDDDGAESGSAYVFRHDDNGTPLDPADDTWLEEVKLTASDADAGDWFGYAVGISGNYALIGARRDDAPAVNSGSAYVFRVDDNDSPFDPRDDFWVEEAKLIASNGASFDEFGFAVAIEDDRAVVGSWLDDDGGSLSGSVYVFRRDQNASPGFPDDDFWVEEARLTASDASAGDELGKSVSIHGNLIAAGAFEDDDACTPGDVFIPVCDPTGNCPGSCGPCNSNTDTCFAALPECCDSGSAYVFKRDDGGTPFDPADDTWVEAAKIVPSDTAPGDFFGRVALTGDVLLTGSVDAAAGTSVGAAYAFYVGADCMTLVDFADFQACFSSEGGGVLEECDVFDLDVDGDVDLTDYTHFFLAFAGP